MSSFSVGILYSAQEFTSYIANNVVTIDEFKTAFNRFSLATPEDILQVATKCQWVDFTPEGVCKITSKGAGLISSDVEQTLRLQLIDLIDAEQPAWAVKIPNGRQETLKFLPEEVYQCFKEAGLTQGWTSEIVQWWDRLALATRSNKTAANLVTGRKAEALTMKYEVERTGLDPKWQSIESNFSGYDILSYTDANPEERRQIEVKGSTLPKREAFCFVTQNEWRTAELSNDYWFHLWCLKSEPASLIEVPKDQMKIHIPTNNGEGVWETVKVFFRDF